MKPLVSVFCALGLAFSASANKTDSLKTVLKKELKPLDKIAALNMLSKELFKAAKYDSSTVCAQQALALAEKHKDKKGIAQANNALGNVLITQAGYDEGAKHHSIALKLQLEIKDKQGAADSYNNIGISHFYKGEYPQALKNYLAALKLLKEIDNKPGIARSYSNLGNIYYSQGNIDEALKSYQTALQLQTQIDDKMGMGRSHNNIGSMYLAKDDIENALEHFKKAAVIKEELNDVSIGRTYLNLGNIYFRYAHRKASKFNMDRIYLDTSETYFNKSLAACEKIGDVQTMAGNYNNLGLLYIGRKNPTKARTYIQKAFEYASAIKSKSDIMSSYNGFAVVDSMTGNYKGSLANYKMFIAYRDSMVNDQNTRELTEIKMNFEFEQKEARLKNEQMKKDLLAKHEKEIQTAVYKEELLRNNIQNWSIGGGIVLILLSVILFVNRIRLKQKHRHEQELNAEQKQRATAILEAQEQERKRIAEDLHDSLGHLLSTAKMNLQTQSVEAENNAKSLQLLNQASEELRNISYNLMPHVLEEEGLTPALNELAEKTGKSGRMQVSFQAHNISEKDFDKQAQFNIYRIVQEGINNIIKHAGATEAEIQLIRQDNHLTIMIEDNGKGFDPGNIKKGRGQTNMRARTQWLNGNFHLDSTPGRGTTICIDIPA